MPPTFPLFFLHSQVERAAAQVEVAKVKMELEAYKVGLACLPACLLV